MIVVDCSAVVDALTPAGDIEPLRRLLRDEELHGPALLDYEFVSALRGMTRRREIAVSGAHAALTDYFDLPVHRWVADGALRERAFSLRDSVSADDAAYLALAEALDCPLVTCDARLARTTGHAVPITVFSPESR